VKYEDIAIRKQKLFLHSMFIKSVIWPDNVTDFLEDEETDPEYYSCISEEEKQEYYVKKKLNDDSFKNEYCKPYETLILNFNYTKTAENLYLSNEEKNYKVINIHGELNSTQNPIIFGYGDELDDDYKKIEKLQDNDFLENIKSIQYHKTRNYRELLTFIESEPYQVFVMGHSCGNSDRTLLNTLFEHENCISLKVFYRKFEDGTDDYSNLIRNISRNFNDKQRMRDVVVDHEKCEALISI
jgi:hypothetical protein